MISFSELQTQLLMGRLNKPVLPSQKNLQKQVRTHHWSHAKCYLMKSIGAISQKGVNLSISQKGVN